MTQLTFFDSASGKPLHRASDPETSVESAKETAVKLGNKQMRVLSVARIAVGPQTARELAREAQVRFGGEVETYRKRVRELEQSGLLEECQKRNCKVTGKSAATFKLHNKES